MIWFPRSWLTRRAAFARPNSWASQPRNSPGSQWRLGPKPKEFAEGCVGPAGCAMSKPGRVIRLPHDRP